MTEVASAFVVLLPSARGFGPSLDRQISGQVGTSGKKAGGLFGKAFGAVGLKLGVAGVGIALAGVTKKAISLEADFSQTMNTMAAVANVPKAQLDDLRNLAVKMGADTVFSASDASQAMLELAKNGISPATIKAGALKEALTLAAAGGVSMEDAATTMGNALNAFGLKGDKAGAVAAALAGAANASSASIGSLAEGLAQSSATAADAGLSIQETTAALAAFANAGIQGSDAGTSLKTFLSRLVPQTTKAQDAMVNYGLATFNAKKAQEVLAKGGTKMTLASLKDQGAASTAIQKQLIARGDLEAKYLNTATGVKKATNAMWSSGVMDSAFTDAKGNFVGLAKMSGSLRKSLKGLSDSERSTALNTLFGSDARRAATVLMNQGAKGIEKNIKATSNQSAADKVAAARMAGLSGAIESIKGSLETVTLQFGHFIAPAVTAGLKTLTGLINGIVPTIKKVSASFGGGGGGLAGFGASLKKTGAAVKDFAVKLLPTLQAIGSKIMGVLGPAIKDIAGLIQTQLLPAWRKMLPVLLPVAKFLLNIVGDALVGALKGVVMIVKGVINIVAGVFKLVTALVHGDWAGAWDAVKQIVSGAFTAIIGAIKVWFNLGILAIFKRGALKLLLSFKGLWSGAKGLVEKGLASMKGAAMKGMDAIGKGFVGALKWVGRLIWNGIKGYIGLWRRLFNLVWMVVKNGWRVLRSAFGGAIAAIRTVVRELVTRIIGFYRFLFMRVITIVRTGFTRMVAFFRGLPARILTALGNLKTKLVTKGREIVTGLMDGIKKMGKKLADFVKKFVVDHIPGPVAKALGIASPSKVMAAQARNIPGGMVKGIESQAGDVERAMTRLSSRISVKAPALDTSLTTGSSARAQQGGHTGPMFHVDKVEAQDVNHFLREMQSRARTRAGGGVNF